jgi:hypothetical protein
VHSPPLSPPSLNKGGTAGARNLTFSFRFHSLSFYPLPIFRQRAGEGTLNPFIWCAGTGIRAAGQPAAGAVPRALHQDCGTAGSHGAPRRGPAQRPEQGHQGQAAEDSRGARAGGPGGRNGCLGLSRSALKGQAPGNPRGSGSNGLGGRNYCVNLSSKVVKVRQSQVAEDSGWAQMEAQEAKLAAYECPAGPSTPKRAERSGRGGAEGLGARVG